MDSNTGQFRIVVFVFGYGLHTLYLPTWQPKLKQPHAFIKPQISHRRLGLRRLALGRGIWQKTVGDWF